MDHGGLPATEVQPAARSDENRACREFLPQTEAVASWGGSFFFRVGTLTRPCALVRALRLLVSAAGTTCHCAAHLTARDWTSTFRTQGKPRGVAWFLGPGKCLMFFFGGRVAHERPRA